MVDAEHHSAHRSPKAPKSPWDSSTLKAVPRAARTSGPIARLVARAADGDRHAWDALVDRFARRVWSVARRYRLDGPDADDVFQTTWMRLLERLDSIREAEAIGRWLETTAEHEAQRVLKGKKRMIPTEDTLLDRAVDDDETLA